MIETLERTSRDRPPPPADTAIDRTPVGRSTSWLLVASGAALSTLAAAHALTGSHSRYVSDDYCMGVAYRTYGLVGSVVDYYRTWSGRFAHFFAFNVTEAAGRWTVRVVPGLLIFTWLAVSAWALGEAARTLRLRRPAATGFAAAGILVFATLAGTPDKWSSLYWRPGVLAYFLPMILVTGAVGAAARGARTGRTFATSVVCGVLIFIAGAFTEMHLVLQTVVLGLLALVVVLRRTRRAVTVPILACLAGSALSFGALMAAPGNSRRRTFFPPSEGLFGAARDAFGDVGRFLREQLVGARVGIIAPLILGFVLGALVNRGERRPWSRAAAVLIPLLTVPVMAAVFLPAEYAQTTYPVSRTLIIPHLLLVLALGVWGFVLGDIAAGPIRSRLRPPPAQRLAAILLIASIPMAAAALIDVVQIRPTMASYARLVDARETQIQALRDQGERRLTLALAPYQHRHLVRGSEISPDPKKWSNACLADYYHVESIVALGPPPG